MGQTLLLVDGSSYLYRAFHAMPDLRNAQNEPTGALYGVVNMLRKLREQYPADYIACIFDARGKTFRDELYSEYKAQRPSMPVELAQQVEPIFETVKALGWNVLSIEGVEADDVIATLAKQATEQGIKTIVSTGDKDLAQLVNESVTLVNTMNNEVLTPDAVKEKFGVSASQIVDYLMLIGDKVDNVPGVNKVGPKTAVKWLETYGNIESVIEHAHEIKGVVGDNLRLALEQFPLTRELLTVKYDCDLSITVTELLPFPEDTPVLQTNYERYGFRSWLRDVTGDKDRIPAGDARVKEAIQIPAAPVETIYEMVDSWEKFELWLARIEAADLTAMDTETDSLSPMDARLVGISFCVEPGNACYIPLRHQTLEPQLPVQEVLERLRSWLENPLAVKLLHHAKYDTHVLLNEGVRLRGVEHDSMLAAYVLESHKKVSLEDLSLRWLGRHCVSYESLCGKGAKQISFAQVELDKATQYGAEDADLTLQLHRVLWSQIKASEELLQVYQLEVNVSDVLVTIERNGVLIDTQKLLQQSSQIGRSLLEMEAKAYDMAGQPFNLNSPKQLGEILFTKLGIPVVKKTATGAPSTDEDVLQKLADDYPLPKLLLQYRTLAKLKSTYTDKLPKMVRPDTGRVHTHYAQAAVVTGRLASSDPNLQNIPVRTEEGRRVREAFVAMPNCVLFSADYSQIELRIMAHLSADAGLVSAFARNEDVHRATAAEIFHKTVEDVDAEQRRYAKVINFGLIYGMSVFGLADNLGISRDAAKLYIDRYFTRYPGVAQYMAQTKTLAHDQGYVKTVFGRRLWLPEINSPNGPRRQGAERAAINAPMQGTAADLIKMAMVSVQRFIDQQQLKTRILMQVHDELVLEVPLDEQDLMRTQLPVLMSSVASLSVPLLAELGEGENWEQAH